MVDYTPAIVALIAITVALTTGVAFVLAQPTDLRVMDDSKD